MTRGGDEASRGIRLQKRMAQLGFGSRRACDRLIAEGRVTVDGARVTELGTRVSPSARVALDGKVAEDVGTRCIVLHKPPGYLTARTDPQGRRTVYDLLPKDGPFLAHVGRLDYQTEGVLLFTNDGDLARTLLLPDARVPRVYDVKVRGQLSPDAIAALERGVPLDGRATLPVVVERIPTRSRHDWLRLTLFEGRNRHVRRILEAVGHPVNRLRRAAFGPVDLEGLAPGSWRPLAPDEVSSLRAMAGG
ncbi:MAG: rRNA pseudouridine synthase [Deltaproteobacteria bacterium]|nr:rRNA pseudouridine synthase [Deltaproteobacteria bacterium]MCB9785808.1 rRNA pseudouridine synthase [Deltaproteobacteria bacterium]